jgi:hypothetical protein
MDQGAPEERPGRLTTVKKGLGIIASGPLVGAAGRWSTRRIGHSIRSAATILGPPRSFLGEAAMRQEHKIHEMMERTIAATFDRGGPHYRELRELFHVLHMAYEESKKLADELLDEDEAQ